MKCNVTVLECSVTHTAVGAVALPFRTSGCWRHGRNTRLSATEETFFIEKYVCCRKIKSEGSLAAVPLFSVAQLCRGWLAAAPSRGLTADRCTAGPPRYVKVP